jgi:hypothetical protein
MHESVGKAEVQMEVYRVVTGISLNQVYLISILESRTRFKDQSRADSDL